MTDRDIVQGLRDIAVLERAKARILQKVRTPLDLFDDGLQSGYRSAAELVGDMITAIEADIYPMSTKDTKEGDQ